MVIRKLYVPPSIIKNGVTVQTIPEYQTVQPNHLEAVAYSTIAEPISHVNGDAQKVELEPAILKSVDNAEHCSKNGDVLVENSNVAQARAEKNSENDDIILNIRPGKIAGLKQDLPNGGSCYRFSGIPYAQPPIGELRFKPPVPLERFDVDVLDCTVERNQCISLQHWPTEASETASEDCLFLNVYTPNLPEEGSADGLPVMIWIHGGGFALGSGDAVFYCPNYLVQESMVVVTFNYRLGPLGFMYLPSKGIHGNMGLKDQRMVLRWVQENISSFGGDPNNVTLFGESAGGASVHLNYIAENSRKYFHKAICMSGVSYNPWVFQSQAEEKARQLAVLLGAKSDTDEDVIETLMTASARDIVAKSPAVMTADEKRTDMFFAFTPVVEPADSTEPFITENFISLLMSPNMTSIPIINGFTSNEGLLIAAQMMSGIDEYAKNFTKLVPKDLPLSGISLEEAAAEIKHFFFGDDDITTERLQTLVDIVSDNMFTVAVYMASELHARYQHDAPQYLYVFSFEDELNKFRSMFQVPDNLAGVCHSDELLYLFSSSLMGTEVETGSRADKFRSIMCKLWTNFAKCGNPTPVDGGVNFVWEPVKPLTDSPFIFAAAELNEPLKMVENPFMNRIQFWREIYARHFGNHLVRTK
ncbi:cholinesterase 1-like [Wyeomyia smithii]|uniref:cholinesterase 1-like n=1 Tax=Wyeomyia smithii TaxID=174621 RepID=UPI00246821EE|nr:cholinesterase 1-like [Wyeomyia smithii]